MSASLAPECNEVKEHVYSVLSDLWRRQIAELACRRYDACFLKWYSESGALYSSSSKVSHSLYLEFLSGDSATDECEPLFKKYKSCLNVIAFQTSAEFLADMISCELTFFLAVESTQ